MSSSPSSPTSSPSLICSIGSENTAIDNNQLKNEITKFLNTLGPKEDVLILPPDYTRLHSQAGIITQMIAEYYQFIPTTSTTTITTTPHDPPKRFEIMPALGTHAPMTNEQIRNMFGQHLSEKHEAAAAAAAAATSTSSTTTSKSPFLVHDWRNDVVTIGHVPNTMVQEATRGLVNEPWPAQLNELVWGKRKSICEGNKNVILSIGQGKNFPREERKEEGC